MGRSEKEKKKKIEKNQAGMCPAAPRLRQNKGRKGPLVWTGERQSVLERWSVQRKDRERRYRGSTTIHAESESYSKERKTRGIRKGEEMKLRGKNGRGSGTWN